MTAIKKIPAIRFKGFKEEWEQDKLVNVCNTFTDGDWIESKDQSPNGIRLLQTGNIGINEYLDKPNNSKWINEYTFDKLNCKEVFEGDILISRLPEPAGRACIVPNLNIKMITAVDCTIIRTSDKCESKYLIQFLSSEPYFKEVINFLAGGTRQRISRSNLSKFILPLPKINEQTQIGNYFKELDRLIQLQEQKLIKVANLKKAMLEKMFPVANADVPEIRFKGFTDKWEKKMLGEIAKNYYGGGTPSTSISKYWNGNIPWIQSSDLEEGNLLKISIKKNITELGLKKSATKLIPANSIAIVTRVGVGKLCIMPFVFATSQDFFTLSNLNIDIVFGVFAISKTIQNELHAVQGTSIKGITKDELLIKKIDVPSNKKEQQKIGEYFQNLDQLINQSQQKITQLKHLKQALLQKMFI